VQARIVVDVVEALSSQNAKVIAVNVLEGNQEHRRLTLLGSPNL
jgi:hypothetical protein